MATARRIKLNKAKQDKDKSLTPNSENQVSKPKGKEPV
jgi:hypothetical protein